MSYKDEVLEVYIFPEGEDSQAHQLEMLHAEWDADNRYAKNHAPKEMSQSNGDSADKPPDHIHDACKTSVGPASANHVGSERPKGNNGKLKGL